MGEVAEESSAGGLGKHLHKNFSGEWFHCLVVGVVDDIEDEGGVLPKAKYEVGVEKS
jgi:hypothetical protein